MKTKLVGCCLSGLALILTLSISARPDRDDRDRHDRDDERGRAKTTSITLTPQSGSLRLFQSQGTRS